MVRIGTKRPQVATQHAEMGDPRQKFWQVPIFNNQAMSGIFQFLEI